MHRRTFLAALAAAPVLTLAPRLFAQPTTRVRSVARDARGTTLWLALEHAPFPSPGAGYRDDTVIVFVPAHYRYRAEEGVAALVHFHGHNTTADRALTAHELREQMVDSKQNAILVVPQLAVMAADGACGKLESPRCARAHARRGGRRRGPRRGVDARRDVHPARSPAGHRLHLGALGRLPRRRLLPASRRRRRARDLLASTRSTPRSRPFATGSSPARASHSTRATSS